MKLLATMTWLMMALPCFLYASDKEDGQKILVGLDVTPILVSDIGTHFSLSIAQKWTIYAGTQISFRHISFMSAKEIAHNNEFTENEPSKISYDQYRSDIAVQYWPKETFKGHFLSFGFSYGNTSKTDCILEYGYRVPLGRNFGITLSLKAGLRALLEVKTRKMQIINIGLNYDF